VFRVKLVNLQIVQEEKLCENSAKMGRILMNELSKLPKDIVTTVRGKGLLCAIVINSSGDRSGYWDIR